MRWYERPEVLDYIINCYAGMEGNKRQFLWELPSGDVVIGNSRAFTDHISEKFSMKRTATSWASVHEVLRAVGEVAHSYTPRCHMKGGKFVNQLPDMKVIRRRARD